jgi:hypothetical protein
MLTPTCPFCHAQVQQVAAQLLPARVSEHEEWRVVAFLCESCSAILGLQVEPYGMQQNLIRELQRNR